MPRLPSPLSLCRLPVRGRRSRQRCSWPRSIHRCSRSPQQGKACGWARRTGRRASISCWADRTCCFAVRAERSWKRAPTSRDLWGLGTEGYYLDLPGNPLDPGCRYERQFRPGMTAGRRACTRSSHGSVAPRQARGRVLVLLHVQRLHGQARERLGDGAGRFAASTAAEALRSGPYEVDVSQHAGGERSGWTDTKLQKEGTHPVIYDATGSHANYSIARCISGGARARGLVATTRKAPSGCTSRPFSCRTCRPPPPRLRVARVPGPWGQKEGGDQQWAYRARLEGAVAAPIEWAAGCGDTSIEVPKWHGIRPGRGQLLLRRGDRQGDGFELVAHPSGAVRRACPPDDRRPAHRLGHDVLAPTGSPSPAPASPGRSDLPGDDRIYAGNIPIFAAAGAIFVPVYVLAAAIQWVIFHLTSVAPLVALDGRHGAVTAFLAVLVGGVGGLFASVIATGAVAVILGELDAGRRISRRSGVRARVRRWRSLGEGWRPSSAWSCCSRSPSSAFRSRSIASSVGRCSPRPACSTTSPPRNPCGAAPSW